MVVSRVFGEGFRSFLNDEKMFAGIAPRLAGVGGLCGGLVVLRSWFGLKTVWSKIPRAYASGAEGLCLKDR